MSAVADTGMSRMFEAVMDIWNIGATASGAASCTRGASQLATEASSTRGASQPATGASSTRGVFSASERRSSGQSCVATGTTDVQAPFEAQGRSFVHGHGKVLLSLLVLVHPREG